jgi:transglutaminase-like putative cysteine protease
MIRYRVVHRTHYDYGAPMSSGQTLAHLRVRATPAQEVLASFARCEPLADETATWVDAFGNLVDMFVVRRPHDGLELVAESDVVLHPALLVEPGPSWEDVRDEVMQMLRAPRADLTVAVCRLPSTFVPADVPGLEDLVSAAFPPGRPIGEAVTQLCHDIHEGFVFDPEFSDISTPLTSVVEHRRGVCQDFAHLTIACLRSVGLSARYVSGYLETEPPPDQPRLIGSDASHAWCSVYVPDVGWIDLDPTNDQLPVQRHITIGWGRDYADVAPVRGVVVGPAATQRLSVSVDVTRVTP